MKAGLFLTGTDTGCGKTYVSCQILKYLDSIGLSVVGLKPIASGADTSSGRLVNEDVSLLHQYSNVNLNQLENCRYIFPEPCSPHIAAHLNGEKINLNNICQFVDKFKAISDIILVEGIGGWHVPINSEARVCELAEKLNLPVLLVVSNKLGCLNHASLTFDAISTVNVNFCGWILNRIETNLVASSAVETSLEKIFGCAPTLTVDFENEDFDLTQFEAFQNVIGAV